MKLKKISIDHFRSIEKVEINFPDDCPVVLFGSNNSGKSNILKAIECLLGEKHASYIDFEDSDFFDRDRNTHPNISLSAEFDQNFYRNDRRSIYSNKICFSTNLNLNGVLENTFHFETGEKMYLSNDDRIQCQFVLVDATRDISRQLSYFSQYSILSRMSKQMHSVLVKSAKTKLDGSFKDIKAIFESVPEYKRFHKCLQESFSSNIEGFEHKLEIDFSAYDPNNYFNALRIIAKENDNTRSFNEFGTGEQQILLMSFIKAYAETFKGTSFLLGIEEPEAHLHPLAQKWLAKNIDKLSKNRVQTIITTHSPEFLNIENLEGFIRVYKLDGVTKTLQNSADSLSVNCIKLGANFQKTTKDSVLNFYRTNTFYDQLKGFFARKIILVEGPTEMFSLPNYFLNMNYDLIRNGVEIIDCRGKSQIIRNYRLFKSYGYDCYCLFDADSSDNNKKKANEELGKVFKFDQENMNTKEEVFTSDISNGYGYFGKDYESYLRKNIPNYKAKEIEIDGSKILIAKIISEDNRDFKPSFVDDIAKYLNLNHILSENIKDEILNEKAFPIKEEDLDDIPF